MDPNEAAERDGFERAWELAELIAGEAVEDSPDWTQIAAWADELASAARELSSSEP